MLLNWHTLGACAFFSSMEKSMVNLRALSSVELILQLHQNCWFLLHQLVFEMVLKHHVSRVVFIVSDCVQINLYTVFIYCNFRMS